MASRGFIELLRLADLAKARRTGRNNPTQAEWLGVVFLALEQEFIAPLGEVSEVLAMPSITAVPLTKSWFLGVANVRGRLLPISDLAGFVGINSDKRLKSRKVMVVDKGDVFYGVVVDQVLGIGQYVDTHYVAETMNSEHPLARFCHGQFVKDGKAVPIFMPSLLSQDDEFSNVAYGFGADTLEPEVKLG